MEHLDWLLTESKSVVTTSGVVDSHAHSVMQANQSGDAESHQSNRSRRCCSAEATRGQMTKPLHIIILTCP